MKIKVIILAMFFLCAAGVNAATRRPVRDGFVLKGAIGQVVTDPNGKWFFKFDAEVTGKRYKVEAGAVMELLKSSALEKMLAWLKEHEVKNYRLWGTVTQYRGSNFIFPVYFMAAGAKEIKETKPTKKPVSMPAADVNAERSEGGEKRFEPAINDPNDELQMPEEIIAKLKKRKIIHTEQLKKVARKKPIKLEQDAVLINRTGFVVKKSDGASEFVIDGLGRNIDNIRFELLACQALEIAESKLEGQLNTVRFTVAGVLTKYENEYYLLLHRARKIYSYGNFPR